MCIYLYIHTHTITYQTSTKKSFCTKKIDWGQYWVWTCHVSDKSKATIGTLWDNPSYHALVILSAFGPLGVPRSHLGQPSERSPPPTYVTRALRYVEPVPTNVARDRWKPLPAATRWCHITGADQGSKRKKQDMNWWILVDRLISSSFTVVINLNINV